MVGEDVLITGAGPIGIMAVAIARFIGARHVVITDVNDYRLDLARRMGATRALNVKTRDARRRDEASSAWRKASTSASRCRATPSAFRDMLRAMHHGGSIAMLGIPPGEVAIDWNQVIFKGLVIKGIYGREMFETWYKMAAMLQSGLDVSGVITHRFPASDYARPSRRWAAASRARSSSTGPLGDCRPFSLWEKGTVPSSPDSLHPAGTEVDRPPFGGEREQRPGALEAKPTCGRDSRRGMTASITQAAAPRRCKASASRQVCSCSIQRTPYSSSSRPASPAAAAIASSTPPSSSTMPAAFASAPGPHAALGEAVDLLGTALASRRDALDERAVVMLDRRLQDLLRVGPEAAVEVGLAGEPRGPEPVVGDADLVERALEGRDHREHADRSRDRRRRGQDAVGIHRDVVAARGRDGAHRGDDRLAGRLAAPRSRGGSPRRP